MHMNEVGRVFVFDLDGVITSPDNTRVNHRVVDLIYRLAATGYPIAVNTGRSLEWVEQNFLSYIRSVGDQKIFHRLIVVCEKGGEFATFSGGETLLSSSEFALDPKHHATAYALFRQHSSILSTMFWDATKRTMATIEKAPTSDLDKFHEQQKLLSRYLREGIEDKSVRIDPTTVATDVESVSAGKYAGSEIIRRWVGLHFAHIQDFVCFGDSLSDFDMAKCFAENNYRTKFVYVGEIPLGSIVYENIDMHTTKERFDKGTLEYLKKQT